MHEVNTFQNTCQDIIDSAEQWVRKNLDHDFFTQKNFASVLISNMDLLRQRHNIPYREMQGFKGKHLQFVINCGKIQAIQFYNHYDLGIVTTINNIFKRLLSEVRVNDLQYSVDFSSLDDFKFQL